MVSHFISPGVQNFNIDELVVCGHDLNLRRYRDSLRNLSLTYFLQRVIFTWVESRVSDRETGSLTTCIINRCKIAIQVFSYSLLYSWQLLWFLSLRYLAVDSSLLVVGSPLKNKLEFLLTCWPSNWASLSALTVLNDTVKVDPLPWVDCTDIFPFSCLKMFWQMWRPRPLPFLLCSRLNLSFERKKGLNKLLRSSSEMPTPVSVTFNDS